MTPCSHTAQSGGIFKYYVLCEPTMSGLRTVFANFVVVYSVLFRFYQALIKTGGNASPSQCCAVLGTGHFRAHRRRMDASNM
jgi:hypothetical protein